MKFVELGIYDENALEHLTEVEPLNYAKKIPLPRLNYILGFVKKRKPEIYDAFVEKLKKNYAELKKENYIDNKKFDISKVIDEFENLKQHKTLAENSLNYFLSLLELPLDSNWEEDKLKIKNKHSFRSYAFPSYQNLVSLSDTVGKEEAIKLYKIFVTEYITIRSKGTKGKYETLEEQREDEVRDFKENPYPGWVRIESTVENGKLYHRRETCLLAEAIKDLPDKDFRYLVACYKDFQGTIVNWNENFVLTMDHSIVKGDPYCSCVIHDTRINWDLTHPDEDFWENIWPLQKLQKKSKKKADKEFKQEFQQLGFYAPETLEIIDEKNPLEIIEKSSFNRLDYLLKFIKLNKSEIYESFVENLQKTYAELVNVDYYNKQKIDINELLDKYEELKKYKQLAINSLNYCLSFLKIPNNTNWVNEKVKTTKGNFFRSFLIPRYQNVSILSETIGRDEGIKLYKIYRTEHAKIFTAEKLRCRFETLEDLRKDDFDDYENDGNPGWVRIEGIVKDGKFVYRKDSCLYAEAMKNYPDKEFKFLAACYYDYQGTQIQWNKNFILTMDHTIAGGDPYCSCVVHDTRIDWDLTHPDEEFWESIWPLQKWQKKNE
ncbi:MAG: hypothetical protein GNW80_11860 [Asgard group archaeon]|nr:hypothetical protein [Asgard group archaeon]